MRENGTPVFIESSVALEIERGALSVSLKQK